MFEKTQGTCWDVLVEPNCWFSEAGPFSRWPRGGRLEAVCLSVEALASQGEAAPWGGKSQGEAAPWGGK